MALPSNVDWECNASGNSANSGGFVRGGTGTDYSQSISPRVIIDGATITGVVQATTTDLLITGYTVAATDVDNILNSTGGTMTVGYYRIVSVNTGTNTWTLDRSAGTAAQTCVGRMGGAKAHPADVQQGTTPLLAGHIVYCKGNFTIATATTARIVSTATNGVRWIGYVTTRGDGSLTNRPVWTWSGASVTGMTLSGAGTGWTFEWIKFDGATIAGSKGVNQSAGQATFIGCQFDRFVANALQVSTGISICVGCEITNCTTANAVTLTGTCHMVECVFNGNTVGVVNVGASARFYASNSLWYGNTGATTDAIGVTAATGYVALTNCTINGSGRYGFSTAANSSPAVLTNCLLTNNTTNSVQSTAAPAMIRMINCATWNNTDTGVDATMKTGTVTLTGDPYNAVGSSDFRLNNTSGAGLACQAAGFRSTMNTFATARNIGAMGPAAAAGAGLLVHSGMTGGMRG